MMKTIRGFRPLSVCPEYVLWAKGYTIFVSDHEACKFNWICDLPVGKMKTLAASSRLLQRLGRLEVYNAVQINEHEFLLSTRGVLWRINILSGHVELDHCLRVGSRPLSFLHLSNSKIYADGLYFGEYWGNPARASVGIYHRSLDGVWSNIYRFPDGSIDHIHSLVENPGTGEVWILTGDFDGGSGFWLASRNFESVQPLLLGSQEYRATWAAWHGEKAYFATDSQSSRNAFRSVSKEGNVWKVTTLASTYGSSVYSAKTKKWTAFSTVVEPAVSSTRSLKSLVDMRPGTGILGKNSYVYLWRNQDSVDVLFGERKDWLPPALFQFGSVLFPEYLVSEIDLLYCYCVGLRGLDGCTLIKQIA